MSLAEQRRVSVIVDQRLFRSPHRTHGKTARHRDVIGRPQGGGPRIPGVEAIEYEFRIRNECRNGYMAGLNDCCGLQRGSMDVVKPPAG